MMKSMAKTLPGGRGSTSPTSTTSSSSGVSSAASHSLSSTLAGRSSSSKNNSKSCDRIHAIGRNLPGVRRRDKSLDSHVKYRTDAKSSSKGQHQSTVTRHSRTIHAPSHYLPANLNNSSFEIKFNSEHFCVFSKFKRWSKSGPDHHWAT